MSRYNLILNWVTFENDKEKGIVELPCEVALDPGKTLSISYREPGLKSPVVWRGEFNGVTYPLKRESRADNQHGEATMHYLGYEPKRLEGFWNEGDYSGCWWIEIDEEPEA